MKWLVILAVTSTLILFTNSQLTRDQMASLSLKARKLPNDICGESTINENTTISESNAQLGAYPWFAAIGYMKGSKGPFWTCQGSLVTDRFVVTIAQCIDPRLVDRLGNKVKWVRLGDLDLDDSVNDGASPVDIEVESTKFHPEFSNYRRINDIGLVKLKTKVQFNALIKPICLPSPEFHQNSFVNFTTVAIGWGRWIRYNKKSTCLSEASVVIKDSDICRRNIRRFDCVLDTIGVDGKRIICASILGQVEPGRHLLMLRPYKGKIKMFLVGMVFHNYNATFDGYTRVSYYMNWIIDNLEL